MKRFYFLFLFVTILISAQSNAQNKPAFWDDIQQFKRQDSISKPPKNGIVFIGSSSFTNWKELETVFKDYNAINRGFGGSTLAQANYYVADLVYPYEPRQVVIYSGENDIASDQITALQTLDRFSALFTNIRKKYPNVVVTYISIKNSPSRVNYSEIMTHANLLIKNYLASYKNTSFVDVNSKMLTKNKELRPELFLEDMLHLNAAGYAIWIKEITPYLIK